MQLQITQMGIFTSLYYHEIWPLILRLRLGIHNSDALFRTVTSACP
jgi:hypothetical protein